MAVLKEPFLPTDKSVSAIIVLYLFLSQSLLLMSVLLLTKWSSLSVSSSRLVKANNDAVLRLLVLERIGVL